MMGAEYRVGNIVYRRATQKDNEQLQSLLCENGMESWIEITLERKPDYFAADNLMGESITVIAHKVHDDQTVLGIYSAIFFKLFWAGKVESVIYLCALRIHPRFRHSVRFLKYGYQSIRKLVPFASTLPFMITSIATENHKARRILEANLKGMPRYVFLDRISSLAFSAKSYKSGVSFRQACREDIPLIVDLHNTISRDNDLAPVLEAEWLLALEGDHGLTIEDFYLTLNSRGNVEALFALWDQSNIKQTVVQGYRGFWIQRMRRVYNLYAGVTGKMTLPKPGASMQQIYIAFMVSQSEKLDLRLKIVKLAASLSKTRGAKICVIGLNSSDKLCNILVRKMGAKCYQTNIEAVFLDSIRSTDIAMRNIQPEVALL